MPRTIPPICPAYRSQCQHIVTNNPVNASIVVAASDVVANNPVNANVIVASNVFGTNNVHIDFRKTDVRNPDINVNELEF
ncbi:uncharacterized protein N7515_005923 [Penicillium bovifimosum]|uniref:Uncharacterized protein n=1 Tax=Penicillium bovifimosum TaxID=126998 RepID=A0A9W9GTN8_9EURO|nr:uncharacterized protein N7515_005923 [Penicillium bovifimosum]KAJ5129884.1 hypothetical protein N7515_005923 [Penicillium bovifimosum]